MLPKGKCLLKGKIAIMDINCLVMLIWLGHQLTSTLYNGRHICCCSQQLPFPLCIQPQYSPASVLTRGVQLLLLFLFVSDYSFLNFKLKFLAKYSVDPVQIFMVPKLGKTLYKSEKKIPPTPRGNRGGKFKVPFLAFFSLLTQNYL